MKDGERAPVGRPGSSRPPRVLDGRTLTLEVLRFFSQDPDNAAEFFDAAGLDVGDLRAASAEPAFLTAALDFLTADDRLLLRFAEQAGLSPHDIAATAQAARERGTWSGSEA